MNSNIQIYFVAKFDHCVREYHYNKLCKVIICETVVLIYITIPLLKHCMDTMDFKYMYRKKNINFVCLDNIICSVIGNFCENRTHIHQLETMEATRNLTKQHKLIAMNQRQIKESTNWSYTKDSHKSVWQLKQGQFVACKYTMCMCYLCKALFFISHLTSPYPISKF